MHGGIVKDDLKHENAAAVAKGCDNLKRHLENVRKFGVPPVVAINRFITDTDKEIVEVMKATESSGAKAFLCTHWGDGGKGIEGLARHVVDMAESGQSKFKPLYPDEMPLRDKVKAIATEIYRACMNRWRILQRFPQPDWSIVDLWVARHLLSQGWARSEVQEILRLASPDFPRHHGDPHDYLRRTVTRAAFPHPPRTVWGHHARASLLPRPCSNSTGGRYPSDECGRW